MSYEELKLVEFLFLKVNQKKGRGLETTSLQKIFNVILEILTERDTFILGFFKSI